MEGSSDTMCRAEGYDEKCGYREECEVGFKYLSEVKVGKSKSLMVLRRRMKLFIIRVITIMLLCACVVQLMALGETWGPRLLKGWPSCFSHSELSLPLELSYAPPIKAASPPKSEFWACLYYLISFFLDLLLFLAEKSIH